MNELTTEIIAALAQKQDLDEVFRHHLEIAINQLLQTELAEFLGYERYSYAGINTGNNRNGSYERSFDTKYGQLNLTIPRDRNGRFENHKGLSSWLANQMDNVNDAIHPVIGNLFVTTSGPKPPNPAELLGSNKMTEFLTSATRKLDLVIVDAPPILPVTDSQLLANKVDGTVLVVRQGVAQKAAVRDAVNSLKKSQANILGTVLNDVRDGSHHGYYGYNSGYGYYRDEDK